MMSGVPVFGQSFSTMSGPATSPKPGTTIAAQLRVLNLIEEFSGGPGHPGRSTAWINGCGLIEKVILRPDPDAPHGHRIELLWELSAILSLYDGGFDVGPKRQNPPFNGRGVG
jgi:hypothetical protein